MNDLTTTPNSTLARPTAPELTPELSRLLDSDSSPDAAVREIARSPALLDEVRAALPALQSVATAKAGEEGVHAVIKRRFPQFPQPERSAEDWRNWWADYYETLAHVPLASLEAGMRSYVATPGSEFMPKPWKLLELSDRTPSRSLGRFQRAKRALQFAEESLPAPEVARVTPAEVKAMLAEFEAKSVAGVKPVERPDIGGVPDERGITAEMRALIQRRQQEAGA